MWIIFLDSLYSQPELKNLTIDPGGLIGIPEMVRKENISLNEVCHLWMRRSGWIQGLTRKQVITAQRQNSISMCLGVRRAVSHRWPDHETAGLPQLHPQIRDLLWFPLHGTLNSTSSLVTIWSHTVVSAGAQLDPSLFLKPFCPPPSTPQQPVPAVHSPRTTLRLQKAGSAWEFTFPQ